MAYDERAAPEQPIATNGDLQTDLKAEVRRLLAAILIADYRADMQWDTDSSDASPEGNDRGDNE